MLSYRAYEHTLHINTSLSLPPAQQEIPDYTILIQNRTCTDRHAKWIHNYTNNGDYVWLRLGRIGADYILRFIDIAEFLINEENNKILFFPNQGTKSTTIEHLLLDQVLPRLISRKNYLVIHAGAISSDFGAIAHNFLDFFYQPWSPRLQKLSTKTACHPQVPVVLSLRRSGLRQFLAPPASVRKRVRVRPACG